MPDKRTSAGCKLLGQCHHIGDRVWVGGKSVILPGVKIGNDVVIASGSVVTGDIPDRVIAGGVPARVLKHIQ